jgi:hypothetical protein
VPVAADQSDITRQRRREAAMSWGSALGKGLLIVIYFIVTVAWLPDRVITLGVVADAASWIGDLLVLTVWGVGLFGGMYMLRRLQSRGII